jgi:hypothetical protein
MIDIYLSSSRFTSFKTVKSGFWIELIDRLAIPSEPIDCLFIRNEHLGIYKNRTTDCPDQYELVDRFIYQMNNNGYKTTNFY